MSSRRETMEARTRRALAIAAASGASSIGIAGSTASISQTWTVGCPTTCVTSNRLYCFQQ